SLRQRLRQERENQTLVAALENLRLQPAVCVDGELERTAALAEFPRLFRERGFDVLDGDPAATAEPIRESAVPGMLGAGLDDWAVALGSSRPERNRVLEVADLSDDNAQRRRIRELWRRKDTPALKRLADEADPATFSAAGCKVLAQALPFRDE